jgi:ribose-phosphate pyrophosphokinase
VVITDTINNTENAKEDEKIRIIPISVLLGEAIRRISEESSVSSLFEF